MAQFPFYREILYKPDFNNNNNNIAFVPSKLG
jgi:hypothetical protein